MTKGDAGERLAAGGHVRIGVAAGASEIPLLAKVAVVDGEQVVISGGALRDVIRWHQLVEVHASEIPTS